jgi:lipoprotein-anchoring transpeptidase ErfK/SrfK
MGDGRMTSEIDAYELPGVPWVSFFEHMTGVAFHGTYWHDNFGSRMSHGCVNMRVEDAKWLYRWSTPIAEPGDWIRKGYGTRVEVIS